MAYRKDSDMEFLADMPSVDLDPLVKILTTGKGGDLRLTEELTNDDRYLALSPDHHAYWDLIAAEIQCFGANTLATLARGGEGVQYREVLTDICDKMKVNYNNESSVETIERNLLMKVLIDSMKEMSPDELETVCNDLKLSPRRYTSEAVTIALQVAIKRSGFLPYKISVIVANAVVKALIGRGLPLAVNAALTRLMGIFVGPIGWTLSAVWLLVDIAGPAYRVTIPAVIMVAYLREKNARREMKEEKKRRKKQKKRMKMKDKKKRRKKQRKRMKKLEKKKGLDEGKNNSSGENPEGQT